MAYDLQSIIRGGTQLPPILTVHGGPGIGKTTLAANAPAPLFLAAERGLGNLTVPFVEINSWADLMGWITFLFREQHEFKTVVLDSLTAVEPMIWDQIVKIENTKVDKKKTLNSIEDIGYGKGYALALTAWSELLAGLEALRNKGMIVILIAHSFIKRYDAPDSEPYDRFLLKLHERAAALITERSDIVGFASQRTTITQSEVGFGTKISRGVTLPERTLALVEQAAFVAKNRYGMPDSVRLEWSAFMAAMTASRTTPKGK